jgi:RNA polymerase sigma factor for flagellar operon FliA
MSPTDPVLYDTHAAEIDRALAGVCRRRHLRGPDAAEFAQNVYVWLLGDAAALLHLHGKSDAKAYLFRTIDNKFLDFFRQCNGRWRPSAAARRNGRLATDLEELVEREGLTLHEAVETIHARSGTPYESLEALLLRLRSVVRMGLKPRVLSLTTAGVTARAERAFVLRAKHLQLERDDSRRSDRVQVSLNRALSCLEVDQLKILADHFGFAHTPSPTSAGDRQRPQNRARLEEAIDALRELLASCGIGWPEARRALETGEIEINAAMLATGPDEGIQRQDKSR